MFFLLFVLSCLFSFFFPFVMNKEGKACFNAETNDFDQRMTCGAPVCWSKYTSAMKLALHMARRSLLAENGHSTPHPFTSTVLTVEHRSSIFRVKHYICCVFWPAFGYCAHLKAGQNTQHAYTMVTSIITGRSSKPSHHGWICFKIYYALDTIYNVTKLYKANFIYNEMFDK